MIGFSEIFYRSAYRVLPAHTTSITGYFSHFADMFSELYSYVGERSKSMYVRAKFDY